MIIAALTSRSVSHIYGLEHLDRGYENFELKLSKLGTRIERLETKNKYRKSNLNRKEVTEIEAAWYNF